MEFVIFKGKKEYEQSFPTFEEAAEELLQQLKDKDIGLEWYTGEHKRLVAQTGWGDVATDT